MSNTSFVVLVNAVVFRGNKVLVAQRSWEEEHMPGRWTIPGGKVETESEEDVFEILEKTAHREVMEETGVEIVDEMSLVMNNSFLHTKGHMVIAMVFRCAYVGGEAKALEDTIECRWATREEVEQMEFAPNVKEYILRAWSVRV